MASCQESVTSALPPTFSCLSSKIKSLDWVFSRSLDQAPSINVSVLIRVLLEDLSAHIGTVYPLPLLWSESPWPLDARSPNSFWPADARMSEYSWHVSIPMSNDENRETKFRHKNPARHLLDCDCGFIEFSACQNLCMLPLMGQELKFLRMLQTHGIALLLQLYLQDSLTEGQLPTKSQPHEPHETSAMVHMPSHRICRCSICMYAKDSVHKSLGLKD